MQLNRLNHALLLCGLCSSIGQFAYADDSPPQDQPQKVEKISVTGSNIKRVNTETSSPIEVITAEEISARGAISATDLLNGLVDANAGSQLNVSAGSSFASGASSLSLRGLGAQATLILINGRRISNYGMSDGGGNSFVNTDQIPASVIERIEVLRDGASAIYGSDAIAGVVNIIMKTSYVGAEAQVTGDFSNIAGMVNSNSNATIGFGDLSADHYNIFINFGDTVRKSKNFHDFDRYWNTLPSEEVKYNNFGNPAVQGRYSNPGTFNFGSGRVPANGCANPQPYARWVTSTVGSSTTYSWQGSGNYCADYDFYDNLQIIPKSDNRSFYSHGTFDISDNLQGYTDVSYNQSSTIYQKLPYNYSTTVATLNPQTGSVYYLPNLTIPANSALNPTATKTNMNTLLYKFAFPGFDRSQDTDANEYRVLAGLKGNLNGWDWDSAIGRMESTVDQDYHNSLNLSSLQGLINNGQFLNFINAPTASQISSLFANPTNTAQNATDFADFKITGEFGTLAGGPIGVATGVEYLHETKSRDPDPLIASGQIYATGAAEDNGSRNVFSQFVEFDLPVLKNLDLSAALRNDQYSDYGRSTTPKFGFKWTPVNDSFAIRGNYSEGFIAPSLTQISHSALSGYYSGVNDPMLCNWSGPNPTNYDTSTYCSQGLGVIQSANTSLKPTTAKTYTLGFIFEPIKSVSMTLDYYDIKEKNIIQAIDPSTLLEYAANGNPNYVNDVIRSNTPVAPGLPGAVILAYDPLINIGGQETKGVDLEISYKKNLGEVGRLTVKADANYISAFDVQNPDGSWQDYNGTYNEPRAKANVFVSLARGPWTYTALANFVSQYSLSNGFNTGCNPTNNTAPNYTSVCSIPSDFTINLGLKYEGIKNTTLGLVVKNALDRSTPYDNTAVMGNTQPGNFQYGTPYGRELVMSAKYKFW